MQIAVFGTGAVGGYFGGRLAEAGEAVTFIARGENLRVIRERGLRVDSVEGDFHLTDVRATDKPEEIGPVDVVLVATKAWQVVEAAEAVRPMVGDGTVVIGLQNGVEAADQLSSILGAEHVAGGSCAIVSMIEGPGHIRHAGASPRIVFGDLERRRNETCERLLDSFRQTRGVRAVLADDIHSEIWRKFLFIAPVSGVGAVTRVPLGVCRSQLETRSMIAEAMEEIRALAFAHDVPLPDNATKRALEFLDSLPAESTASMQRDIMDGRPSELEAQNGAVVRLGALKGVDVPVHRFIYASLVSQETLARQHDS
jgi:2-dehydropantoate 2-reductase